MKTVKNTIRTFAVGIIVIFFSAGCEKNEPMLFDDMTRVYFSNGTYEFSFANYPGVTEQQMSVALATVGKLSNKDRIVKAELYGHDTTNTADPKLYTVHEGVIPANSETGRFYITFRYDEALDSEIQTFHIIVVPNEDFPDVNYAQNTRLKVNFSAQEMRPENWSDIQFWFGMTYSTRWWKFIKEATGMTIIPFKFNVPEGEEDIWWMDQDGVSQLQAVVRRALRDYNAAHPGDPLKHDDGTEVTM